MEGDMRFPGKAIVLGVLLLHCPSAQSQRIDLDTQALSQDKAGGYWMDWEPTQSRLMLRRDVENSAAPAIKAIDTKGKTLALYPLRDFSGSSYLDVWDATGAPNGDVVMSVILAYGPRKPKPIAVKSLLLTYDSAGTLRAVWDVKPYHHHIVAMDAAGNVFAFGHADGQSGTYPLIVKYSPQGDVVAKFLPTSLFPTKDAVVDPTGIGAPRMFIKNDKLFLFVAATQEIFAYSLDGALERRTSLKSAFDQLVERHGLAYVQMAELSIDTNQNVIAQLILYPKDRMAQKIIALARFAPGGALVALAPQAVGSNQERFLGLTNADEPVYLERTSTRGSLFVDLTKHYASP
jgi:hypothetical protein